MWLKLLLHHFLQKNNDKIWGSTLHLREQPLHSLPRHGTIFKSNDFTCFVWLVQKPEAGYKKGQNDQHVKVCLLPIAKMFIAIRSGAWKREKYTSLDVVFSLVQIKVGMSKSQVRRCVIIVYLLSFFITSGASKNWPKRSPILTKINWTKFRVRLSRVAQNVPTFFLRKTLRCPEMYITQTLCVVQPKFRWRTTTLPITFSHALLFSISDSALTHNCFFFCLPRSKKKTCLGQQYNHEGCRSSVTRNKRWTQCFEITQNVAFSIFTNSLKWTILGSFNQFLSTQNVNVARFACNVEWDFFCDFRTL